ncbi:CDP-alcohol phosphatidyltransferase family protein [Pseudonocardiaceae bacterium YIM PH 21723]|nr:CDP-alcohol phosphatidyltransferase family protein [Pseudonocardiaceae bacterium YIM PH 21723]
MLNVFARHSVSRVTDPIGAWLVRRGFTANAVTVYGTLGACAAAVIFFPMGWLLTGTLVATLFVLFDLFDGAMARSNGGGTAFGEVLDATCDRVADGVLFAAVTWWAFHTGQQTLAAATLACLLLAQVISYVKARAEAAGLRADGGLVERAERLIVLLVGTGLTGIGVPYAVDVAIWLLLPLSLITVVQRLLATRSSAERR